MKCFHHNDLDGRCAAAIVRKALFNEQIEFIEVDYKDRIKVEDILEDEAIIIVDFSFKPEIMEEVLKKTCRVTWIDHHKTAFEYKYSQELSGIRDNDYSGCELTWKYFFQNRNYSPRQEMPRAVALIGDFDKWAWKLQPDTGDFKEGLRCHPHGPEEDIWCGLLTTGMELATESIIIEGRICRRYREVICADYVKAFGFETEFEGHKAFACGFYQFGSEKYGELINQYPLLVSFEFSGEKYTIGLYSTTIDVSVIAKNHGGGGHKGAAGFVCDVLPFRKVG